MECRARSFFIGSHCVKIDKGTEEEWEKRRLRCVGVMSEGLEGKKKGEQETEGWVKEGRGSDGEGED